MPRPRKSQYTKKEERTLYVLKSPTSKKFIVGKTLATNERSTYKDHYILSKYKTAGMIEELKSQGLKPCCFRLETLTCTEVEGYHRLVVWTRLFIENGYEPIEQGNTLNYAMDLLPHNQKLFDELQALNLNEMLTCSHCLFPNYGRKMCALREGSCNYEGK